MPQYFHVSSSRNRESILRYGLDWTRMGAARGIAGSDRPEVEGVFLCRSEFEVEFFIGFDATDLPVDVWAVDGVDVADLVASMEGFEYLPACIPPARITLLRSDAAPATDTHAHRDRVSEAVERASGPSAYASTLTITLDDGTILRDEEAREWVQGVSDDPS